MNVGASRAELRTTGAKLSGLKEHLIQKLVCTVYKHIVCQKYAYLQSWQLCCFFL